MEQNVVIWQLYRTWCSIQEVFWRKGFCGSECWILLSLEDQEIVSNSCACPISGREQRCVSSRSVWVFCALGQWDLPWAGMLESQSSGWSWWAQWWCPGPHGRGQHPCWSRRKSTRGWQWAGWGCTSGSGSSPSVAPGGTGLRCRWICLQEIRVGRQSGLVDRNKALRSEQPQLESWSSLTLAMSLGERLNLSVSHFPHLW